MATTRGDTPPRPLGPPGPAPPGPLPSPIGPPALYEEHPHEGAESDDITLVLEAHQVALAKGRARFDQAQSTQDPLLEHDVAFLARSVTSAVALLKFLVRQTSVTACT